MQTEQWRIKNHRQYSAENFIRGNRHFTCRASKEMLQLWNKQTKKSHLVNPLDFHLGMQKLIYLFQAHTWANGIQVASQLNSPGKYMRLWRALGMEQVWTQNSLESQSLPHSKVTPHNSSSKWRKCGVAMAGRNYRNALIMIESTQSRPGKRHCKNKARWCQVVQCSGLSHCLGHL